MKETSLMMLIKKKNYKKTISTLEDGFEEMEYITDESLIITIKYLFDNFTYIDKEEFNIKLEEKIIKHKNIL